MPNWIKNRITFYGDENAINQLKALLNKEEEFEETLPDGTVRIDKEENPFNFNAIVPMPKELKIESGSRTDRAFLFYMNAVNPKTDNVGFEKLDQTTYDKLEKLAQNQPTYHKLLSVEELIKNYNMTVEDLFELGKLVAHNYLNYGASTWYDWCRMNWGCKWNSSCVGWVDNSVTFETPWACPIPIIQALAGICEKLGITFYGAYSNEDWVDAGTFDMHSIQFAETEEEQAKLCENLWGWNPLEENEEEEEN